MKSLFAAIAITVILSVCAQAHAQQRYFDVDGDADGSVTNSRVSPEISLQPIYADVPAADTAPSPDMAPDIHPTTLSSGEASSRPEAESANEGQFPAPGSVFGLGEFMNHFAPYEPIYYIYSAKSPTVKFQISFRYRMFPVNGSLMKDYSWLRGFNVGFTLTAVQDTNAPSVPVLDISYKPELFYYWENIHNKILPAGSQLGLMLGIGHESNGQGGAGSRELNMIYLRPIIDIPIGSHGLFITFAPKIYDYIGGVDGNTDIARYRGYADIKFVLGQRDGLQLSTIGRIGSHFDRGSVEMDLSYPLTKIFKGNHDVSVYMQYFDGYGDYLLDYNKRTSIIRLGFALVR